VPRHRRDNDDRPQPRPHLRYHAARRRAVSRLQHDAARKAAGAKALAELGVDIIEAGFPIASPGDWESVNLVAREVRGPIIAGLARCTRDDIDTAWRALKDAARPRIHVFLATSAIHREYKPTWRRNRSSRRQSMA